MNKLKYPYQNLSLKNIRGETWADVPELEMYCKISCYGRLKRLEYTLQYSDGRIYEKPEKIIKPVVMKLPNEFVKDEVYFLHVAITIHKNRYNYSIARLVYYCFIEPFNMEDDSIIILTNDGNGLNIRPANLKIASHHEKQQRIFALNRRESLDPGPNGRLNAKITLGAQNNKPVTQYNLQGEKIKSYPSVIAASMETGISHNHISNRARGTEFSAGGFIWRYGKKLTIDVGPMNEAKKQRRDRNKEAFGKKVTKYSMNGKWLARYPTISDAAKATGVAKSEISKVIHQNDNRSSAGGFFWRKGHSAEESI